MSGQQLCLEARGPSTYWFLSVRHHHFTVPHAVCMLSACWRWRSACWGRLSSILHQSKRNQQFWTSLVVYLPSVSFVVCVNVGGRARRSICFERRCHVVVNNNLTPTGPPSFLRAAFRCIALSPRARSIHLVFGALIDAPRPCRLISHPLTPSVQRFNAAPCCLCARWVDPIGRWSNPIASASSRP